MNRFDTPARQAALGQGARCADRNRHLTSLGPLRRWLFRKFLVGRSASVPCREEALFYMGAAWTTLRRLALELGRRLVAAGTLASPDDMFFLEPKNL